MQIKKWNKQWQSMKIRSTCTSQWQKEKKQKQQKQEALFKQTALVKAENSIK